MPYGAIDFYYDGSGNGFYQFTAMYMTNYCLLITIQKNHEKIIVQVQLN